MSIDLGMYSEKTFTGKIVDAKVMRLREYLGDRMGAFRRKMRIPDNLKNLSPQDQESYKTKRLDSTVIVVAFEAPDGTTGHQFVNIPKVSGYQKSNLKKLLIRNKLPVGRVPAILKKWVGKSIELEINEDGFYRIST